MTSNATSYLGKRERKNKERDDAIKRAALGLARRGTWPTSQAISERTRISVSVIERQKHLLVDARREWEKVTGKRHPQWRDPEHASSDSEPITSASDSTDEQLGKLAQSKDTIRRLKRTIKELKVRIDNLEERERRLLLGVRPHQIKLMLEARAPKGRPRKAN